MKISGVLFAMVAALMIGCGSKNNNGTLVPTQSQSNIIGGTLVPASSALSKSIVGIYDNNEGFTCTGSLLPGNLVVTAAHCIGSNPQGVYIVFAPDMESLLNMGRGFLTSPYVRPVVAMKANEDWNARVERGTPGNDIGLMKYSGTTPDGYVPAKLLNDPNLIQVGANVLLAGYGVDTDKVVRVNIKTPNLQKLIDSGEVFCDTNDATTAKQCIKEQLSGTAVLKATTVQITAIENPKEVILDEAHGHAACSGDSGGPAYMKVGNDYLLFGATSRSGLGCNKDIVYTNVLTYIDWIKTTAAAFGN